MGTIWGGLSRQQTDRTYGDWALIRRIGGYFRPERRRMCLATSMIVLHAAFNTARPLLVRWGIDAVAAQPSPRAISALAVAILALGALTWTSNAVRRRAAVRATGNIVLNVRLDAFRAVLGHDLSFFDESATGGMVSRITSDAQDLSEVASLIMELTSQVLVILPLLAILLVINWRLTLVVLSAIPVVVLAALGLRAVSRPAAVQERQMRGVLHASVGEAVAGIPVAKNYRREDTLWEEFQQVSRHAYRVELWRGLVVENMFPAIASLQAGVLTLILYAGGLRALDGEITPGTWYLFIQALGLFIEPLMSITSFWGQFQGGLSGAERVFALIDAEPRVIQVGHQSVGPIGGRIEFRNVSFAYRPGEDVLCDFYLVIQPRETVAFVGHTGAGKSSLARLIARFYEFHAGQILVDGQDIRTFDLSPYRRQIGMVPQEPFLFSGTLMDNIRCGVPSATDEQVRAAAQRIGGGDWLNDLASGMETGVGERGARLSMGQRQLVALARVMVQDPAILILDEATASVDPLTEAQIQEGLETVFRDRTSIIIAHRLSTVEIADRILVLARGRIIEQGTHENLLQARGHYADLYNTYFRHQSLEYIEEVKGQ